MTCILVVGCYRSGTSAIAGVLHHLGVFMGQEFADANFGNARGYFEDMEFVRLHYELMHKCTPETVKQYKELIKKRNDEHEYWGVKDPRLCVLLNDYFDCFSDVQIIFVTREKTEIAASMARQIGYSDPKTYLSLVEYYVQKKNEFMERIRYKSFFCTTAYEYIKAKPELIVELVAGFVNRPISEAALKHLL